MNRFLTCAVLAALPGTALAQTPDAGIAKAKTLQTTVTIWNLRAAKKGEAPKSPEINRILRVQADNATHSILVEEKPLKDAPADFKPSLFVSDGKTQYDYLGGKKQYMKATLKEGNPARSRTGLMPIALDLIANQKTAPGEEFKPAPDEKLADKTLKVWQRVMNIKNGKTEMVYTLKLWNDAATKLPVRFSYFVKTEKDGEREVIREEYSDWKLNAPLKKDLFAWAPPKDATEYKQPERPALLTAGTLAPDFTSEKWGGGNLKLSDYKGKVVILDFWSTWCGPCQRSMPHIEKVYQATKDEGVVTIGLCVWDEKKAYEDWMSEHKTDYTFQFAFDPAGNDNAASIASKIFKVSGIPTTYVIDKDGKVATAIVGYDDNDKRLEEALAKLGVKMKVALK